MKWKTDDFIHAFMMLCYFFYEKLWLKHELVNKPKKVPQHLINKPAALQAKYEQFIEKKRKQEADAKTEASQLYFYNNVY